MKNKRGEGTFFGKKLISIIVAILCIILVLFVLPTKMWGSITNSKSEQAESSMNGDNGLAAEISRVNSKGEERNLTILNPSGWYIFSFVDEKEPNLCAGNDCVCICEKVLIEYNNNQLDKCDDKGSCVIVKNLQKFEKIKIENDGVTLLIKKINDLIVISKK